MKRTLVSYYDVEEHRNKYNSNNLHEYDPYDYCVGKEKKTLFIDCDWWRALTPFAHSLITQRIASLNDGTALVVDQTVPVPHEHHKHAAELCVYRSYLDAHDFQCWYERLVANGNKEEVKDVQLWRLSAEQKQALALLTRKRLKEAQSFGEEKEREVLTPLLSQLTLVLGDCQQPWFMRLSGTSGKNEIPLEPVFTVDDILRRLTCNILFLHQEYEREDKETYIVLRPWNDSITKKNEFRVFVYNGKITGVSQQHWYKLFCFSDEELDAVETAILKAPFLTPSVAPYQHYVADVWVSLGADEQVCHLIEYNPFGVHCGAGSSLFDWRRDYNALYGRIDGDAKPELRVSSLLLE